MTSFKDWLLAQESGAARRHARANLFANLVVPSPEDAIQDQPYGKMGFCGSIGNYKTYNIDVSKTCGNKDTHKPKAKKPNKVK